MNLTSFYRKVHCVIISMKNFRLPHAIFDFNRECEMCDCVCHTQSYIYLENRNTHKLYAHLWSSILFYFCLGEFIIIVVYKFFNIRVSGEVSSDSEYS